MQSKHVAFQHLVYQRIHKYMRVAIAKQSGQTTTNPSGECAPDPAHHHASPSFWLRESWARRFASRDVST